MMKFLQLVVQTWTLEAFELNFEVNAFIYDEDIAKQLRQAFEKDIEQSKLLYKRSIRQASIIN